MLRWTPFCSTIWIVLAVWTVFCSFLSVSGKVVPLIQPGFFFDYNPPAQPVPIPVTSQCERIHIQWGRQAAIGANPVAPYRLQVYTSTDETPFIIPAGNDLKFDWDVPFAPGTLYQICMFDKNGTPGGCQATYTVIANTTTQTPTCQNVTAPPALKVEGTVTNGPMSRYGFVDQCTDIALTPKGGKPPYTMTVSPALHPPYNLTSNDMSPINWTVSLSWAMPFFISVVSSDGLMWANGPMHAGGFGTDDCLAPGSIRASKAKKVAIGAGVGSLFGGLVLGALITSLVLWRFGSPTSWRRKVSASIAEKGDLERSYSTNRFSTGSTAPILSHPQPTPSRGPTSPASSSDTSDGDSGSQGVSRTYVIHRDAGLAPVTVVSSEPTQFVELPPSYIPPPPSSSSRPSPPQRSTSLPDSEPGSTSTSPVSPASLEGNSYILSGQAEPVSEKQAPLFVAN